MQTRVNKTALIEWTIAVILIVLTIRFSLLSYGGFTPLTAFRQSERTAHYGPSTIVRTIDVPGGRIYLGKYKDWFTADLMKKGMIKWYTAGGSFGKKIDYAEQLTYNWDYVGYKGKEGISKIYGFVNNPKIVKVRVTTKDDSETQSYDLDESRMFIFYWFGPGNYGKYNTIRGLDKEGNIIYETQLL